MTQIERVLNAVVNGTIKEFAYAKEKISDDLLKYGATDFKINVLDDNYDPIEEILTNDKEIVDIIFDRMLDFFVEHFEVDFRLALDEFFDCIYSNYTSEYFEIFYKDKDENWIEIHVYGGLM